MKITRAGDGLSAALAVAPVALHSMDEVFYVLRGVVRKISHDEKDGVMTRVHIVETNAISPLDAETANKALSMAAEETERLRAEAAGQLALQMEGDAKAFEDHTAAREAAGGTVSPIFKSGDGEPQ